MTEKECENSSKAYETVARHIEYPPPKMSKTLKFTEKKKLTQEISTSVPYKHRRWHPFGASDGALTSPPRDLVQRYKEEAERRAAIAAEKKYDSLPENIVNLRDLADGTWLYKSQKARALKRKELFAEIKKKRTPKERKVIRDITNIWFNLFLNIYITNIKITIIYIKINIYFFTYQYHIADRTLCRSRNSKIHRRTIS